MLGLWTIFRAGGLNASRSRMISLAAVVFALGLTPHGRHTPQDWLSGLRCAIAEPPLLLPRDEQLAAKLGPDDTIWDVQDADAYLAYHRGNPTRHALAYCIPSAAEQRLALADLKRRPPRFIFWRHASRTDLLELDIPNPLRYYLIAPWVYSNYRPTATEDRLVLEPAPAGWKGLDEVAERFSGPMPLGWLAERWGAERIDLVHSADRTPISFDREMDPPIHPREWNYLLVEAAADGSTIAQIEFRRPGGDWDRSSFVSWRLHGDRRTRRYLIPIGCSPGWSWSQNIRALKCRATKGLLTIQSAALCRVQSEMP
jgi:hypothetical protein